MSGGLNEGQHPVAELREAERLCSANREVGDSSAEAAKHQLQEGASERVAANDHIAIAGSCAEVDKKEKDAATPTGA